VSSAQAPFAPKILPVLLHGSSSASTRTAAYPAGVLGNLGAAHILVLIFAALFILGPERLPGAAAAVAKALRQVQQSATNARAQLTDELGPEFDDLRKPLADLQQLRGMTAKSLITQHLFDGDANAFTFSDPAPAPVSGAPVSMAKGTSSTPSPRSPH